MLDRRAYLLTACIGLLGANSLALAPIAPVIAADFNYAPLAHVLWAVGGFGLGTAASALILAPFVDRIGAATALRVAMFGLMLCFAGSALAPALWALIACQTIAGIIAGVAFPSTYGLGTEIAPKGQEARTMGLILTGWTVAMVFGVTCATLIADFWDWRLLFAVFAGIAAMLLGLLLRMQVPPWTPRAPTNPLTALRLPGMTRSASVAVAFMLAFYGCYPFLAPHIIDTLGLSPSATALPVLAYGIGFGISTVLDPYMDRLGYRGFGPYVFGSATVILASLAMFNDSYLALTVIMGLYGIVNHAGLTLILNRLVAVAPARKGAILGLYSCTTYICVTLGAVAFTPLFSWGGFAAVTTASAFFAALMLAELWYFQAKTGEISSSPSRDH